MSGVREFAAGLALVVIGLWVLAADGPGLAGLGLCVLGALTCVSGACQRVLDAAEVRARRCADGVWEWADAVRGER